MRFPKGILLIIRTIVACNDH